MESDAKTKAHFLKIPMMKDFSKEEGAKNGRFGYELYYLYSRKDQSYSLTGLILGEITQIDIKIGIMSELLLEGSYLKRLQFKGRVSQ